MGSAAIPTSLKWIGLIVLYFFVLFIILGVVRSSVNYVEYGDFNFNSLNSQCGTPRYFLDNGVKTSSLEQLSANDYSNAVCGLKCADFYWTNESCSNINGCSWVTKTTATDYFTNTMRFLGYWVCMIQTIGNSEYCTSSMPSAIINYECSGTIDAESYGINVSSSIFGGVYATNCQNDGTICTDSSVLNNKTLCSMMSCSWLTKNQVIELKKEDIKISKDIFGNIISSISDLVTLRYTFFGTDAEQMNVDTDTNAWLNGIISFILFYLPILLLIGALYGLFPAI